MFETRKLQKIGGTSLYVSLPKRWTDKMQLKHGDKVTLIPQPDGSISIYSTAKQDREREMILEVNAEETKQSLKRRIIAAYVDGFDAINLKAEGRLTDEQQNSIREVIDSLFGLEAIEITGKTVRMQCLLKSTLPVEKTIRRIHNIVSSMFTETISALKEHDLGLIRGLTGRMRDIKRLSLVAHRLLRTMILFPRPAEYKEVSLVDCVDYSRILHRIGEVADNVNKISETVATLGHIKGALPSYILESLYKTCGSIHDLYSQSIQALLSSDIPLANRVLDSRLNLEGLWKLCIKADERSEISSLALSCAYLLIDKLEQMQQYAAEIAEIAIDRAQAETKKAKVINQVVGGKESVE